MSKAKTLRPESNGIAARQRNDATCQYATFGQFIKHNEVDQRDPAL